MFSRAMGTKTRYASSLQVFTVRKQIDRLHYSSYSACHSKHPSSIVLYPLFLFSFLLKDGHLCPLLLPSLFANEQRSKCLFFIFPFYGLLQIFFDEMRYDDIMYVMHITMNLCSTISLCLCVYTFNYQNYDYETSVNIIRTTG